MNIHVSSKKMDSTLKELLKITQQYKAANNWTNAVWVVDFDGTVRAAQRTLELALRYYKEDRSILVHANHNFY